MKEMSFWNSVIVFFWREESSLVLAMALLLAALLFHFHNKEERKGLINTVGFFFVCLTGQFVSGVLHAFEFTRGAEVLHEAFVIGGGIALIRLWGLLIFRVVLPAIRLSPPRITEDIFVILAYIAWGMEKKVLLCTVIAAGSNVVLNLIWIPAYGAKAAAVNTLISYVIFLTCLALTGRYAEELTSQMQPQAELIT